MSQTNPAGNPVVQGNNGQGPAPQNTGNAPGTASPNTGNAQQTPSLPEVLRELSQTLSALQQSQEQPSRLEQVSGSLETFRTVLLNGVFLLFIAVIAYLMIGELRKKPIVIEPIAVPESLAQQGYTSDVVSVRIMDEFRQIQKEARTVREKGDLTPEWSQRDIEVPGTSFTIESAAHFLRDTLNFPVIRILGEITQTSNEQFDIQLRVSGVPSGGQVITPDDEAQIDDLIHQVALELLGVIDPYILAVHLYDQKDHAGAKVIIDQMLQTLPEDDDPWAYTLWGLILHEEGKPDAEIKMYQKAIEIDPNFNLAYTNWGYVLENEGDLTGAVEMYRKGAEQGDPIGQIRLGIMYDTGKGVDLNHEEAMRLFSLAAEQGNAVAQVKLGIMYEYGKGVDLNYEEAVRLYRLAADQANALGQYFLGLMYDTGKGVEQNYEEAVRLYRLAAEQEDSSGQFGLGQMYENGKGVEKDYAKALEWYTLAADQDDSAAQVALGIMYENGKGVEQHYTEAVEWYRKAAEQGNSAGQRNLALMYEKGLGYTQDYAEAAHWYRQAAEREDVKAQAKLAAMYEKGQGVTEDYDEAMHWYRKAANQGDEFSLGVVHEEGIGESKDLAEAASWYRKAANKGNKDAMNKLAVMYEEGRGVAKDLDEAERWRLNTEYNAKRFSVPCFVEGEEEKKPFWVYVLEYPSNEENPLAEEQERLLKDHGATIPEDAIESFSKLYAIAQKHNTSFLELAVYALGAP